MLYYNNFAADLELNSQNCAESLKLVASSVAASPKTSHLTILSSDSPSSGYYLTVRIRQGILMQKALRLVVTLV